MWSTVEFVYPNACTFLQYAIKTYFTPKNICTNLYEEFCLLLKDDYACYVVMFGLLACVGPNAFYLSFLIFNIRISLALLYMPNSTYDACSLSCKCNASLSNTINASSSLICTLFKLSCFPPMQYNRFLSLYTY